MTREHLKDFHSAITAQVMLIQAEGSPFYTGLNSDSNNSSESDEAFTWVSSLQLLSMPGSHHLHMEDQAPQVAEKVQSFLQPIG